MEQTSGSIMAGTYMCVFCPSASQFSITAVVLSVPFNPSPKCIYPYHPAATKETPSIIVWNTNTHRIQVDGTVKSPNGLVRRKCTTLHLL